MLRRFLTLTLAASVASLITPAVAESSTITFETVPSSGNPIVVAATSDGFDFSGLHFHTIDDPPFSSLVSNGSLIYLLSESENDLGRPITMARSGGGTFTLNQFDGAETFLTGNTFHFINVTGNQSGGGILSAQFTLDGLRDGAGGIADFETFSFVGWNNLLSATFDGALVTGARGGFSIDNLVVDAPDQAAVPEPTSLLLLGTGGLGLLAKIRRRKKQNPTNA